MRAPNSSLSGVKRQPSHATMSMFTNYLIKHIRTLNGNARIFTNAITIIYEACGSVRFGRRSNLTLNNCLSFCLVSYAIISLLDNLINTDFTHIIGVEKPWCLCSPKHGMNIILFLLNLI